MFQCHRVPQNVSHHKHKILLPLLDKEHMDLGDKETGIYDSCNGAFFHKSLSMVDIHHHNIGVYKHDVHNLSLSGISSHTPTLDGKEPTLFFSLLRTCKTW